MAYTHYLTVLIPLITLVSNLQAQSISVGPNIFESLDGLGCSQFKAIILEAQLQGTFSNALPLTLFVFNDTTFSLMPPWRQGALYEKGGTADAFRGAAEYVNSFTLQEAVQTPAFSVDAPYQTYSALNRKLFLNRRELRIGNVASGMPGPTRYFCNGAMLIRPNIQAGMHVIHIIDQVLDMPLIYTALAYASGYNPQSLASKFYQKIMLVLQQAPQEDEENNYNRQVQRVLTGSQVTFFMPSDEAINQIPAQKLSELQGNLQLMLEIITLHIVPNQVLYTSLVNHNERFNTQYNSGAVVFRKNYNREAVYVTGALGNSGRTVTARINPANITVINGVVHQIDELLGFVYKSAIEEIGIDPNTQNFEQLISASRQDLQNDLTSSSGVTVFAPINQAMYAIANVYPNYINNQSLLNTILESCMLMQGQSVNLMGNFSGYESYTTVVSRYNNRLIKVYSEGDDTMVEGGYVIARIVKPDIGVTNGVVHQIDGVFGVPTRDIPYTIFCRGWLTSFFIQMQYVGLDKYMRDPTLARNQACSFSSTAAISVPNNGIYNPNNITSSNPGLDIGLCGNGTSKCEFTIFAPNGTAIDNFAPTQYGTQIMNDPPRWSWILRRLITSREKIYLDQIPLGTSKSFYADNGEEVVIQVDSRSSSPNGIIDSYIIFQGVRAKIIRSDIGATNGVIHIISSLLFVPEDLNRDVSGAVLEDNTTVETTAYPETTTNPVTGAPEFNTTEDTGTPNSSRHDFECHQTTMDVFIPVFIAPNSVLILRDPSCHLQNNGTHYVISFSYGQCGTSQTSFANYINIENEITVQMGLDSGDNPIQFASDYTIPLKCSINVNTTVHASFQAVSREQIKEQITRLADFQIHEYRTADYQDEITDYPVMVPMNREIFFELTLANSRSNDSGIKINKCAATPSPDPNGGSQVLLITNGCSRSSAVKVLPRPTPDRFRFSTQAFHFGTSGNINSMVYVHCDVSVCQGSSCNDTCSGTRRRRSARNLHSVSLTSGQHIVTA